jgi:hypothetical protein
MTFNISLCVYVSFTPCSPWSNLVYLSLRQSSIPLTSHPLPTTTTHLKLCPLLP